MRQGQQAVNRFNFIMRNPFTMRNLDLLRKRLIIGRLWQTIFAIAQQQVVNKRFQFVIRLPT